LSVVNEICLLVPVIAGFSGWQSEGVCWSLWLDKALWSRDTKSCNTTSQSYQV